MHTVISIFLDITNVAPIIKSLFDNSVSLGILALVSWVLWKKITKQETQYLSLLDRLNTQNASIVEALTRSSIAIEQNTAIIQELQELHRRRAKAPATKAKTTKTK
jgi:hypothetical protein